MRLTSRAPHCSQPSLLQYTFGSIDKGITSRALQFTHVTESELGDAGWQFASTAWTLDGVKLRRGPGTSAIADTGASSLSRYSYFCMYL